MKKTLKKIIALASACFVLVPALGCSLTKNDKEKDYNVSLSEKILEEAKKVTDFARDEGFTYGHASINPGINWEHLDKEKALNPKEKITSCDRFVDWVLYRAGFTDQPYDHGLVVFQQMEWLESLTFEKIEDVSKLKPGDIVFSGHDSTRPGDPRHVFICASENLGNNMYLRYDHGSNERIACRKGTEVTPGEQPFEEPIYEFYYAYRPNDSKIDVQLAKIDPCILNYDINGKKEEV